MGLSLIYALLRNQTLFSLPFTIEQLSFSPSGSCLIYALLGIEPYSCCPSGLSYSLAPFCGRSMLMLRLGVELCDALLKVEPYYCVPIGLVDY